MVVKLLCAHGKRRREGDDVVAVGGHRGRGRGDWGVILPPLTDWLRVTRSSGPAESRLWLGGSGVGGSMGEGKHYHGHAQVFPAGPADRNPFFRRQNLQYLVSVSLALYSLRPDPVVSR